MDDQLLHRDEIDEETVAIVERVIDVAEPERVILFGSAARDEQTSASDADLLVVKSNVHRRKLAQTIYRNLMGLEKPVDIVVATPQDLEKYRGNRAVVIGRALEDGILLYDRRTATTG